MAVDQVVMSILDCLFQTLEQGQVVAAGAAQNDSLDPLFPGSLGNRSFREGQEVKVLPRLFGLGEQVHDMSQPASAFQAGVDVQYFHY